MPERVSSWPDSELICNCNTVAKGTIVKAIRERGLTTREQVALSTKASTGCGSCAQLVEDLVRELNPARAGTQPPDSISSGTSKLPGPAPSAFLTPRNYPKNLDVAKIKKDGLGLDFTRIRELGVQALSDDDYYRLKTYGVCSQKHPEYFMLRIRIPGGRVSSRQLEQLSELAKYYGRGWGHLTTRQDMELHWVRLGQVPEIWEQLEAVGLSTRSACGHTLRNVMACPHSAIAPASVMDVGPWAKAISDFFVSRSEYINPTMPNRLNVFFAGCSDCATHAQINDIAFVAVAAPAEKDGKPQVGFVLWAGGSLGSYPVLGFQLKPFLPPEDVLPACQAIFHIYRQHGGGQKGKTRLKFLIEELGREKFVELFEQVFREKKALPENRLFPLALPARQQLQLSPLSRLCERIGSSYRPKELPPGWQAQKQEGFSWAVAHVPLGEIRAKQLAALGQIAERFTHREVYFNMDQDVELHWVRTKTIPEVQRALEECGLTLRGTERGPRVTACPGTEFCVLAVTNAQGAARELIQQFEPRCPAEEELLRGLSMSVSGCPNSCAKHQVAGIGFGGGMTSLGDSRRYAYQLYLGGQMEGEARVGVVVRKGLTEEMIAPTVRALLDLALEHRQQGESFREVVGRLGPEEVSKLLEKRLSPWMPRKVERIAMLPELTEV